MGTEDPGHGHNGHHHGQDDRLHGHGLAHHDHGHSHDHKHGHGHRHGVIDPSIASSARGLWAVKWSFMGLMTTALFQVVVVAGSGRVAFVARSIPEFPRGAAANPAAPHLRI